MKEHTSFDPLGRGASGALSVDLDRSHAYLSGATRPGSVASCFPYEHSWPSIGTVNGRWQGKGSARSPGRGSRPSRTGRSPGAPATPARAHSRARPRATTATEAPSPPDASPRSDFAQAGSCVGRTAQASPGTPLVRSARYPTGSPGPAIRASFRLRLRGRCAWCRLSPRATSAAPRRSRLRTGPPLPCPLP